MSSVLDYLELSELRFPDREAYEDEKTVLTYKEICTLARSIGTGLTQYRKQPVAVFMDKSVQCIAAFWGVVTSGNFYCPVDTEMPPDRIRIIMEVLKPAAIITDSLHREKAESFAGDTKIVLYEDMIRIPPDHEKLSEIQKTITAQDPLYVLFTSGSTGIPKGVLLSHLVVINYLEWLGQTYSYSREDVFGNQAPFYFDISVHDIYGAAYFGAKMVIIPRYLFGFPARLIHYLNEKRITTFLWVPSAMGIIARLKAFRSEKPQYLRHAMFAGEVFPRKQLDYWTAELPDVLYANLYGPTETFVCTAYTRNGSEPEGVPLPIGRPVSNTEAVILTEEGREASPGEPGELCIRGCCLALGYYGDKERTEHAFVQNPLHDLYPDRVYHTGDLVYEDEKGDLIYISRKDYQIKHMGYRIELGEIENAVNLIPGIENCACVYEKEKQRIVLFYDGKEFPREELQEVLSGKLPAYMMPGKIQHFDALPRNANGKIDRKALAQM